MIRRKGMRVDLGLANELSDVAWATQDFRGRYWGCTAVGSAGSSWTVTLQVPHDHNSSRRAA